MTQNTTKLWVSTTWHGTYQVDVDMPPGTSLRAARITRRPPILSRTDFAVMGTLIDWLASRPGHGLRVTRLPEAS